MNVKKMNRAIVVFCCFTLASSFLWAQMNPRGTATMAATDGGKIEIEYGRPSAKGRDVMAMIEPGSYWRMGADSSTKLQTEAPLLMGGSRVEKGVYTLVGHFVSADEFHLVVARSMESDQPKDVAARVKGEMKRGQEHVEQLTISIEGSPGDAAIVLSWAGSRIRMPFQVGS